MADHRDNARDDGPVDDLDAEFANLLKEFEEKEGSKSGEERLEDASAFGGTGLSAGVDTSSASQPSSRSEEANGAADPFGDIEELSDDDLLESEVLFEGEHEAHASADPGAAHGADILGGGDEIESASTARLEDARLHSEGTGADEFGLEDGLSAELDLDASVQAAAAASPERAFELAGTERFGGQAAELEESPAAEPVEFAATARLSNEDAEADDSAGVAAAASSSGKAGRGPKGRGAAKPAKPLKTSERPKEKRREQKLAASPRTAPAAGSVRFICSECYEEFFLASSYSKETVSCPDCLHVGKRPDEDFLRMVNVHKNGERRSLVLALVIGAVLVVELLLFVWLRSPYAGTIEGALGTIGMGKAITSAAYFTYALLGIAAILLVVFVVLVRRFESNRWEVYF